MMDFDRPYSFYRRDVRSPEMEHVDLAVPNREQYAVPAHNHLTNLFEEFAVFGRERTCFGRQAELFADSGSQFADPSLRLTLTPGTKPPIVRLTHIGLSRLLKDNRVSFHSSSGMPFSLKNS